MDRFIELADKAQPQGPIFVRPDAIMGVKPAQGGCKLIMFGGGEIVVAESKEAIKAVLRGYE